MSNVMDHSCPNCDAVLKFNPTTQGWDCEYCGSSFGIEDLKKYEKEIEEKVDASKVDSNINKDIEMDEYTCQNCGARVVTDKNTTATSCVYCGSTTIIKNRLQGEFKPDKLIPFGNVKETAVEEFLKFSKSKKFAPQKFCDKKNIEEVQGVYIPFWLYDCDTSGRVEASAQNVRTWTSGDYRYTQTDHYKVARSGSMSFSKIPVDGSTKFDDDIMDSIEPYNYDQLVEFNPSYLSGFLAEKFDVDSKESFPRANDRAVNSSVQEFRDTMVGYSSVQILTKNIDVKNTKTEYVLLPVWLLNINYKGKSYKFAMNGQNGKMVGNVPISPGKLIFKTLRLWAIIVAILMIIFGFGGAY